MVDEEVTKLVQVSCNCVWRHCFQVKGLSLPILTPDPSFM